MSWVKFGEILAMSAAAGVVAFFCGLHAARIKAWWPFAIAGVACLAVMVTVHVVVVPQ